MANEWRDVLEHLRVADERLGDAPMRDARHPLTKWRAAGYPMPPDPDWVEVTDDPATWPAIDRHVLVESEAWGIGEAWRDPDAGRGDDGWWSSPHGGIQCVIRWRPLDDLVNP